MWLHSIPDRVLDVWWAYYQCEPFGSQWEQTASIAATVHGGTVMTAAARGVKSDPLGVLDYMPADSVPWMKRKRKRRKGISHPAAQTSIIKQAFGFR